MKYSFASDYLEGAHPLIMERLAKSNLEQSPGYGLDSYSEEARRKIRIACACPGAQVYFLVGGTQTNQTVIAALLRSYEGAIAAESGHINVHEAGAIELCGHKVLALPAKEGKLTADAISCYMQDFTSDATHEHMVQPGMVYLSQPTELGTLYSLSELEAISKVCQRYQLHLYVDGARLAYALASPANDVSLADLSRLCTAFYIGGTKCGALMGEAVVLPKAEAIPHFFTIVKQHGALLAKGRILGIQFATLFTDGLYEKLGANAIYAATRIKAALKAHNYQLLLDNPTNQIFVILPNAELENLAEKVEFDLWGKYDSRHTIIRFATSWATTVEQVEALERGLRGNEG